MNDYEPLKIAADMAAPIVMFPHDALPLDGMLEWAAFKSRAPVIQRYLLGSEANGRQPLPSINQQAFNFKIPVKRVGHKEDSDWYWAASWAQFPEGYETDKSHWNRRFDGGQPGLGEYLDFQGRSEKISVSSGRYKGYHHPLSLVVTPRVEWYCLGDAEGIAKLLTKITHLGKKRSQGWGEVLRWSIYKSDRDRSQWSDAGRPMRALPHRQGDYRRGFHGIRPPYWHHQVKRDLILPDPRN